MSDDPKPQKQKPWSDIDLNRWRDYDEIKTDSLWLYNNRASGDGHRLDYHGNYIPQLATQLFTRYSKKDEIVLDLFLGSGTSAIEAVRLDRRCIGVELKPELVAYVRSKIDSRQLDNRIHLLQGNSAEPAVVESVQHTLRLMQAELAQLLILHPPYADIIRFSDNTDDLSNATTTEAFLDGFQAVAKNGYDLLAPGRFAALIIGDKYAKGELIPLGFWCMERMNRVGFKTKAIIVKNIEGNEKGKGKDANLWRYRALAGGYYIFKHEYVIIFFKPR
ncbi:MAG: RsmD family RNA methyltransferase [Anaerolineae bacterium]|nr:RsmD family RNA methyltransferase [Anaerolineae bacterium]